MALLFCDNFQRYGTGTLASPPAELTEGEVYAEATYINPATDPDPSGSGLVLQIGSNSASNIDGTLRKVLPAAATTIGCGFRFWVDDLPSSSAAQPLIFAANDSGNVNIIGAKVRTDGYIEVRRGANLIEDVFWPSIPLVATSAGPVITAGAWQQIEIKLVIDASAGSIEIRVDGVVAINATGVNTGSVSSTQIVHVQPRTNGNWYMKDYFIWDTSGSLNNSFFGNCFVHSLVPDGDVSGTWTALGGGMSYTEIDEADPDDDTSYISSAWPAATAEVVTLSDLPPEATRVLGMMTLIRAKKTDGGDATLVSSLVSTTNTVDGAATPITTAYSYWTDIFETDPDTSAAWTVAAANAVKLKLDRTA
jgi:hypothetical protein